jgi:hypothetical protein
MKIIFLLLFMLLAVQCASVKVVRELEIRIDTLNHTVDSLKNVIHKQNAPFMMD